MSVRVTAGICGQCRGFYQGDTCPRCGDLYVPGAALHFYVDKEGQDNSFGYFKNRRHQRDSEERHVDKMRSRFPSHANDLYIHRHVYEDAR